MVLDRNKTIKDRIRRFLKVQYCRQNWTQMGGLQKMIDITKSAQERIGELIKDEPAGTKLRVFVQGGGCSGFEYGFTFDQDIQEDDFAFDIGAEGQTVSVLVDSMSMQYLQGAVIEYTEDLMGGSFRIENPNAESTCGCGSSFSPSF